MIIDTSLSFDEDAKKKISPAFQKKLLQESLSKIIERNVGFYSFYTDEVGAQTEAAIALMQEKKGKYTDIVVLGIGGSALGIKTIHEALSPLYRAKEKNDKTIPNLHVLENIDPDSIRDLENTIYLSNTLFIVISKSGGTPETLAEYLYFKNLYTEKKFDLQHHFLMITGESGFLREEAKTHNFPVFSVPENVGGRFSVMTLVGMIPALFIGVDISEMLKGWANMVKSFTETDPKKNLCFQVALAQVFSKKPNHVFMPYASKLRRFGDWFTQLLAESTGKNGTGFTPISALGATDQHSLVQLLSDGPRTYFVLFVTVESFLKTPLPFGDIPDHPQVDFLKGKSFGELCNAEYNATAQALQEKGCPSLTISIPEINAYHLGELFMLFMGATAFLGEVMNIDAYDQPGVERGKVLTKEFLTKK